MRIRAGLQVQASQTRICSSAGGQAPIATIKCQQRVSPRARRCCALPHTPAGASGPAEACRACCGPAPFCPPFCRAAAAGCPRAGKARSLLSACPRSAWSAWSAQDRLPPGWGLACLESGRGPGLAPCSDGPHPFSLALGCSGGGPDPPCRGPEGGWGAAPGCGEPEGLGWGWWGWLGGGGGGMLGAGALEGGSA